MKNSNILHNNMLAPYENNQNFNSEDMRNYMSVKTSNQQSESEQTTATESMKQNKSISSLHVTKSKVQTVLAYESRH